MNELVYIALWVIGSSFFGVHTIWKKGGVMSSAFMTAIFIPLYFTSTNVQAVTDAGLLSTSNPMAQWLALFAAILSTIVLFFNLFGMWEEEKAEDEVGASDIPNIDSILGGSR